MEYPRPVRRRPPAVIAQTIVSQLVGPDITVPSFRSFVKRTPPPPSSSKPLPEVPQSSLQSISVRRSSSVYSRREDQWVPTPDSWKSLDMASPDLFLQPGILSYSSPQLGQDPHTLPRLQPRAYSPLFESPATTPSVTPNPSPSPPRSPPSPDYQPPPSFLFPPESSLRDAKIHHFRTNSLQKPQALVRSPDHVHLLPEEMRSQATARAQARRELRESRSFEDASTTKRLSSGLLPAALPFPANYASPLLRPATAARLSPRGHPSASENPEYSHLPAFEARGRTTRRSASLLERQAVVHHKVQHGPPDDEASDELSFRPSTDAARLAEAHHALLSDQNVEKARRGDPESDQSLHNDIKLVPQPLFFNPRQVSKLRAKAFQSASPERLRRVQSLAWSRHSPNVPRGSNIGPRAGDLGFSSNSTYPTEWASRLNRTSDSSTIWPTLSPESMSSPTPILVRFASPTRSAKIPRVYGRRSAKNSRPKAGFGTEARSLHAQATGIGRRSSFSIDFDHLAPAVTRGLAAVKDVFSAYHRTEIQQGESLRSKRSLHNDSSKKQKNSVQVHKFKDAHGSGFAFKKPTALLADMMEERRETKAARRREDLRKKIKVIPQRDTSVGFEQERRALSEGNDGWL